MVKPLMPVNVVENAREIEENLEVSEESNEFVDSVQDKHAANLPNLEKDEESLISGSSSDKDSVDDILIMTRFPIFWRM